MSKNQSPEVLAFRAARMRRAPRNWTLWVAAFTAVNGVMLLGGNDFMILAGAASPFALEGSGPHFIAAAMLAAIAFLSAKVRALLFLPLAFYLLDTAFTGFVGLWSGFAMHVLVLAMVGMSFVGLRALNQLKAAAERNAAGH